MGETSKAHPRRLREGFYETYCQGEGIDIGAGDDPLQAAHVTRWDKEQGDATFMSGVPDEHYDFVYSSHCLEHINEVLVALKHWWRIVKPGGYLIISLPSRQLYEKKNQLPSNWNSDHRHFWLPFRSEPPCTFSLFAALDQAIGQDRIRVIRVCDAGHTIVEPQSHSDGEYSIEAILRK